MKDTDHIKIVLVEPSKGWNIGSVARAMNNMGFRKLRLVNPFNHLHEKALAVAVHSEQILHEAELFDDLTSAVADCQFVLATSRRRRRHHGRVTSLWELGSSEIAARFEQPTAIVFGREDAGLYNHEMDICNEFLFIPTHGDSKSINLAQATILSLYEISRVLRQTSEGKPTRKLASSKDVEHLKQHIMEVFGQIDYMRKKQGDYIYSSVADLIGRLKPTDKDIRMLRGIVRKVQDSIEGKET